jgi:hypothetical protein
MTNKYTSRQPVCLEKKWVATETGKGSLRPEINEVDQSQGHPGKNHLEHGQEAVIHRR